MNITKQMAIEQILKNCETAVTVEELAQAVGQLTLLVEHLARIIDDTQKY
jgi:hypothetical protein